MERSGKIGNPLTEAELQNLKSISDWQVNSINKFIFLGMSTNYYQELVEDVVYHIYNRSVSGYDLFRTHVEFENFLLKFDKYLGQFFDIYAYCLIPNHFHFLVRVKNVNDIDFSHFKESSTSAYNKFKLKEITLNGLIEDQFRRLFSSVALSYNNKYQIPKTRLLVRWKFKEGFSKN